MDSRVAQIVDRYDANFSDTSDEAFSDVFDQVDVLDDDATTSWQDFCDVSDAWARHAHASNGFCVI